LGVAASFESSGAVKSVVLSPIAKRICARLAIVCHLALLRRSRGHSGSSRASPLLSPAPSVCPALSPFAREQAAPPSPLLVDALPQSPEAPRGKLVCRRRDCSISSGSSPAGRAPPRRGTRCYSFPPSEHRCCFAVPHGRRRRAGRRVLRLSPVARCLPCAEPRDRSRTLLLCCPSRLVRL
jgi:hypothetical protein